MIEEKTLPIQNETPSDYADRLAVIYAANASDEHKKGLGQFFTPLAIARFLANFGKTTKHKIKILDPGCGLGILSSALCEMFVNTQSSIKDIELVAFETDVTILPLAERCLSYLSQWLKSRGINFTYFLCKNDFVLHNSDLLNDPANVTECYDIIICNPPYFKLPKGDERITASRSVIYGQSNIYSIFMVIAARLLKDDGRLIFITPRSFCSGSSFRVFRGIFFNIVDLDVIHLFQSRNEAFKRDKVLQENIIVVATRKQVQQTTQLQLVFGPEPEKQITLSSSEGIVDINQPRIKKYGLSRLLNMHSYQKILHLPVSDIDEQIIEHFRQWTGSLHLYDLEISTGPIVDFRSSSYIHFAPGEQRVPLFWLHNIRPMQVVWPATHEKGKPKGQYILADNYAKLRLVKNQNFVLLRRFSSKDDKSRLVAAPYFACHLSEFEKIGLENHLNYIYHKHRELTNAETMGLAVLFNSKLFDLYFRTFNGNINVSATELRDFPLPDFKLIRKLGQKALTYNQQFKVIDPEYLLKKIINFRILLPKT